MSVFPPSLWRPSAKDVVADLNPEQFWTTGSSNAASAAFSINVLNPNPAAGQSFIAADKVLLVTNVQMQCAPGAGQSVTRMNLRWGYLNAALAFVAYGALDTSDTFAIVAAAQRNRTWSPGPPGFVLMAGQMLEFNATFDAGGVANGIALNVVGILIPRGNWQRT